ncbi:flavohemoglobin expression-modulating QEGLA motif protein [Paraliomyxa miuraensis]|uniref:flavohemoglobin expression-modulating QEGLA motif protein n=1 Tax=Paraliomyxa miuraensis TaxID=376150 RepID=UPI0022512677|nr:flavohemoglobin expression-modulating QEGLA motif protein [Paraliomyxa miuraensis]MCX4241232.1 flavohemoglobin expression-modulating QEGLA motif protein [Paraliomyxa miuraensis]
MLGRTENLMDASLARHTELDTALVRIASSIKVLSEVAWPAGISEQFLVGWRAGNPVLPEIVTASLGLGHELSALTEIADACDASHPVGDYVRRTALSFATAVRMLRAAGTPDFTRYSEELYGRPNDPVLGSDKSLLDAAEGFIKGTIEFERSCLIPDDEICLLATTVAEELQREVSAFFDRHEVRVVLDPKLSAKAAAGASAIRLRSSTCFSPQDIPQLLVHEAFVHTLTKLNGRAQPNLPSLGLGAPRTTRTQEGLALFAELISVAIDLQRLRRIALRVKAIDLALSGADFIDVFRFFLEAGQSEAESFQSAARVFRGGDVRGRVAFTKDVVYVGGLVEVHTFMRKAIQHGRLELIPWLFTGRVALRDVIALSPWLSSGWVEAPVYLPRWAKELPSLTAFLLYSVFVNGVSLREVDLEDFEADGR